MRAVLVMLGAVAMLVGVATQPASAGKGTEFDQFVKRIAKFADEETDSPKPKGLCVCQDGGGNHTRVGVLLYEPGSSGVNVSCWVRSFNSEGTQIGASACNTFEVLSK
jgi:hypothetical protein